MNKHYHLITIHLHIFLFDTYDWECCHWLTLQIQNIILLIKINDHIKKNPKTDIYHEWSWSEKRKELKNCVCFWWSPIEIFMEWKLKWYHLPLIFLSGSGFLHTYNLSSVPFIVFGWKMDSLSVMWKRLTKFLKILNRQSWCNIISLRKKFNSFITLRYRDNHD